MLTVRDIQARLKALGFDPGKIDNQDGPKTRAAEREAMDVYEIGDVTQLFHPSGLHRIVMHWTGGTYDDVSFAKRHYHRIVGGDAHVIGGYLAPEANADTSDGVYAAHTRALNTGSIGVAICAMGGAVESPFDAGKYPLTRPQVDAMIEEVADLCETYDIPLSPWTVLTHAEVQETLGVRQRGKWDYMVLPEMTSVVKSRTVGDALRERIRQCM